MTNKDFLKLRYNTSYEIEEKESVDGVIDALLEVLENSNNKELLETMNDVINNLIAIDINHKETRVKIDATNISDEVADKIIYAAETVKQNKENTNEYSL